MPDDQQAADVWLKSLPLTVLRVRRPSGGAEPEPYGDRQADDRPTVDETVDDALKSGLKYLLDAVKTRAKSQGWTLVEEKHPEMIDIVKYLGNSDPPAGRLA